MYKLYITIIEKFKQKNTVNPISDPHAVDQLIKIAPMEEEMQVAAGRLSVPAQGAATKGADRCAGYTKRPAVACIATDSGKNICAAGFV